VRGRAGHDVTAWGTVRPVRDRRPVLVEQLVRSRWVVIGRPTLLVQRLPDGRRVVGYQLRVRTGRSAALVLRTVAPATPTNVATTSAGVRLGGA
jgi:hypothetical protein